MKYLYGIILVAILGTALLGFIPADHGGHHAGTAENPCPFSQFLNMSCVLNDSSMAASHLGALKSLSNIPLASTLLMAGMMLLATFSFWDIFRMKRKLVPVRIARPKPELNSYTNLERERSWLSIFEHSPSF